MEMDFTGFRKFLEGNGMSPTACRDYPRYVEKAEKYFCNSSNYSDIDDVIQKLGVDIAANDAMNAIPGTGKTSMRSAVKKYAAYRGYVSGIRPTMSKLRIPKRPSAKSHTYSIVHPQTLPDWDQYPDSSFMIRYDDDVLQYEKVPGLIPFLDSELRDIRWFTDPLIDVFDFNCEVILRKGTPLQPRTKKDPDEFLEYVKTLLLLQNEKQINADEFQLLVEAELNNSNYSSDRLLGEYSPGRIIIYYQNFDISDCYYYEAAISNTLAHEYLHAYHDRLCKDAERHSGIYTFDEQTAVANRVREALADMFAFMYTKEFHNRDVNKLKLARENYARSRYNSWKARLSGGWYYAFALYFLINRKYPQGGISGIGYDLPKYRDVLGLSARTMPGAYLLMIK